MQTICTSWAMQIIQLKRTLQASSTMTFTPPNILNSGTASEEITRQA